MRARYIADALRALSDTSDSETARLLRAAAESLDDARRVAIQAGDDIGRMRAEDAARHGLVMAHAHIVGIINRDYKGDRT